jgi:hypothetical protein
VIESKSCEDPEPFTMYDWLVNRKSHSKYNNIEGPLTPYNNGRRLDGLR